MFLIYHTTRQLYLTNPKLGRPMFSDKRREAKEFEFEETAKAILADNRLFTPEVIKEKNLIRIIEETEVK